ncbi:MAG: prepilin peptidase [Microbacteriaceae bacterium]|nr:prepilin peptidase [Microbacteriaceae bacterium]
MAGLDGYVRAMLDALYITSVIVWSVALARVDFREHRLPDRLTLPAIPVALGVLALNHPQNLGFAATAAVAAVTAGVVAHRIADLGLGDVKLVPSVVIIVSNAQNPAENLAEWFVGMVILGGIHAAIHISITRDRHSHIPFGPAILGGMLGVVIAG